VSASRLNSFRPRNGANIWAESYDRQLTSVFATQEDIAQAIAGALRVPLGLQQGESLVRSRTNDEMVYEVYLRARALVRSRGGERLAEAAALLEQVVAREPEFAPAWALLGHAHSLIPLYSQPFNLGEIEQLRAIVQASLPQAEAAANRAIQLDPQNADGYMALGEVQQMRGKWREAEQLVSRALALDADNPDALFSQSRLLADLGYVKRALGIMQRVQLLEPFAPVFTAFTFRLLWLDGQTDAAFELSKGLPANAGGVLARIHAAQGRYNDAADALLTGANASATSEAARLLRSAPTHVAAPQALPRLGGLDFVYLYIGAPDRVLDAYEEIFDVGYVGARPNWLWQGTYQSIRKTERFKALMRKAGFVDYWRERGWPDLCRPMGADDFVCD
jgi:hypothetical protein